MSILLLLGLAGSLFAEPLRVGAVGQQPYVLWQDNMLKGVNIDILNRTLSKSESGAT